MFCVQGRTCTDETWKRLTVNKRWELAKELGLCFLCLQGGYQVQRCLLKAAFPMEGCVPRQHQHHAAIEPPQLNSSAEAFLLMQAAIGDTSVTSTPTTHTACGMTKEGESMPCPGRVALQIIPVNHSVLLFVERRPS